MRLRSVWQLQPPDRTTAGPPHSRRQLSAASAHWCDGANTGTMTKLQDMRWSLCQEHAPARLLASRTAAAGAARAQQLLPQPLKSHSALQ